MLTTDAVLGAAAGVLLVVGLLRVFYFEKGAAYYFSSHAFTTKLSVFIAVGVFVRHPDRRVPVVAESDPSGQTPQPSKEKHLIRSILHGELIGVVIILLCAAIMARGGWV